MNSQPQARLYVYTRSDNAFVSIHGPVPALSDLVPPAAQQVWLNYPLLGLKRQSYWLSHDCQKSLMVEKCSIASDPRPDFIPTIRSNIIRALGQTTPRLSWSEDLLALAKLKPISRPFPLLKQRPMCPHGASVAANTRCNGLPCGNLGNFHEVHRAIPKPKPAESDSSEERHSVVLHFLVPVALV